MPQLVLYKKPDYDLLRKQVAADIEKIKTWKDKAEFYERILMSSEATLFDPAVVPMEEIDLYRRTLLMAATGAFDVIPKVEA